MAQRSNQSGNWREEVFNTHLAAFLRGENLDASEERRTPRGVPDVVVDLDAGVTIRGAAFYEDAYRKGADGVWRICRTGYLRIYEERFPRASLPGLELTASYWETGGRSRIEV